MWKLRTVGFAISVLAPACAYADQGGVAFWLSGQYAAMAAVPPTLGWTATVTPYYYSGSAGGSKTFDRGGTLVADLNSRAGTVITQIAYAPDTKVFGAQPLLGLAWGAGINSTSAILSASLQGEPAQRALSDSTTGATDLFPVASLYWNNDNHNWMTYLTGGIPIGAYNPKRLSDIGIGHAAIDVGGGYTYLNKQTGFEISVVAGLTYNWKNLDTNYRNGIDSHLDWSVSQFISANWQVGIAGYVYQQITDDSYDTSGVIGRIRQDTLGGFRSRVAAVGPQIGSSFKYGKQTGYINLRGYWEFWAQNRVEGYALIATINLPFGQ